MADDNITPENQVLDSNSASDLLGVSPATIRTWKHRKAELFQEGEHFFQENGKVLWTEKGLEVLTQIRDTVAGKEPETQSVATGETQSVADNDPLQRYEDFAQTIAGAIAPEVVARIDRAIMQEVRARFARRFTPQERVAILTEFGLTPVDPNALLDSRISGYLPEQPDNLGR